MQKRLNKDLPSDKSTEKHATKKKLLVNGEHGLITNEAQQVELINKSFNETFNVPGETKIPEITPTEMTTPFTTEEIKEAVNSRKNGKSPSCDDIKAGLIKYSQDIISEQIAELLNKIAKTGKHPSKMKTGILIPLP